MKYITVGHFSDFGGEALPCEVEADDIAEAILKSERTAREDNDDYDTPFLNDVVIEVHGEAKIISTWAE